MLSNAALDRTGTEPAPSAGTVTVASVPAAHPYVQRMSEAPGIELLADPEVDGAPAGVWWPPVILDPLWIERNSAAAQVLHINFGTESFSPRHLNACIDAAHRAGWVMVFTVHDLEHPQLGEQAAYLAQLDVLIRGADALVTLTAGAAAVIRERWGRVAVVIPHPSVLSPDATAAPVRQHPEVRIGTHLKDLRPNVDGPGTALTIIDAVARLRSRGVPAVAEIRLHRQVRDEAARDRVRLLCATAENTVLIEHDRLSDAQLGIALSGLDACVLPYRHGTHSGWLEFCWDLAVPVVAPTIGFYAGQHGAGQPQAEQPGEGDHPSSVASFTPHDPASLAQAVSTLVSAAQFARPGSTARAEVVARRRQLRRQSDAAASASLAALYRSLLGTVS